MQSGDAKGKKAVETQEQKSQDSDDDSKEGKEKQTNDLIRKEPMPELNTQNYKTRMPFLQRLRKSNDHKKVC